MLVRIFQMHLKKVKLSSNEVKIEDAKSTDNMTITLDAVLDRGIEFQNMLETEKQVRVNLEARILQLDHKQRLLVAVRIQKLN